MKKQQILLVMRSLLLILAIVFGILYSQSDDISEIIYFGLLLGNISLFIIVNIIWYIAIHIQDRRIRERAIKKYETSAKQ